MAKYKSYILPDGEVRELDADFFATATRGCPDLSGTSSKKNVNVMPDPDGIEKPQTQGEKSGAK